MSSGSTEPKRIFEIVVEELSLPIDCDVLTKPDLAHEIVKCVDLQWSPVTCESSGGTVTRVGLEMVWHAVEILTSDTNSRARRSPWPERLRPRAEPPTSRSRFDFDAG